ncbi:hypothetical protein HC752_09900 [Vibrio sp. S9_S30]|uniref:hypothetical protein n=1 Tax=Vibrio sp. S9_S30 TaxID=2720226 RepID=UPI0016819BA3|nr:hypothetical protein [Vibrio sp. S9_S30]MBD1557255.1 hypothetical protein [Vibrio sp. S9_S30]
MSNKPVKTLINDATPPNWVRIYTALPVTDVFYCTMWHGTGTFLLIRISPWALLV